MDRMKVKLTMLSDHVRIDIAYRSNRLFHVLHSPPDTLAEIVQLKLSEL